MRELRELVAPQKYRCVDCNFRWLAWPAIYRRIGMVSKVLRWLRRILPGQSDWKSPGNDAARQSREGRR